MIPIECPKCGREGNVPPDRLNAKLTCRGCQAVFHLDNSGRMVMGAPGEPAKDRQRPHVQYARPGEAFNLGEAIRNIPKPVKFGVPAVVVALAAWQLLPSGGGTSYENQAAAVVQALVRNDRARVVSSATSSSSEAAGKWFDVIHALVEKKGIGSDVAPTPSLFSGNPDSGGEIVLMTVLTSKDPAESPLPMNLHMVYEGGSWRLNGTPMLTEAETLAASSTKKSRP